MKRDNEKLRQLLDDVLPPSAEGLGPSRTDVMQMLRHERKRRRRVQASAGIMALFALTCLLWRHDATPPPALSQAPVKPASVVIRQVNDEQLFTLLKGTPTALMKWPDGNRTLLVIEQDAN